MVGAAIRHGTHEDRLVATREWPALSSHSQSALNYSMHGHGKCRTGVDEWRREKSRRQRWLSQSFCW